MRVHIVPDPAWRDGIHAMQGRSFEQTETYDDIIASIALPAGFATLTEKDEVVALAYGVIDGDMLCCESVVTAAAHRGKGYARRMMAALFHWARQNEAIAVCLQVEASNMGGLALYRSLGLATELHRYHYRRRPG